MKRLLSYLLILVIFIFFPQSALSQSLSSDLNDATGLEEMSEKTDIMEAPEPMMMPKKNKIVTAVEVRGNKSVSLSKILSKIKIRVGEEYKQSVVSDDLKRLYNTGNFSDVSVDREDYQDGLRVIIYVVEKSIVDKITFSRTRYVKSKKMLDTMETKEGKFLDKKTLRDDVRAIKDLFSQKGLTDVEVDVETNIEESTNKANLHFVIREGKRVKVKKISVSGNNAFSYKKIIRTIKSRAGSWFRAGYLKEEVLKDDMKRIEAFYRRNGFIDVKANYTVKDIGSGRLEINIVIDEGQKYFVGSIVVEGNVVASTEEIIGVLEKTKTDEVFSREYFQLDLSKVQSLYFDKGYIFVKVNDSTSLNPTTGKVDLKISISEGVPAYVKKVDIEGNTRTRDIVIRREVRLHPGDRFDGTKLRRTKERLTNLGYFEDVGYDIQDTDVPDQKDLVVQVKEAKTGRFSFGGGFSTIDKVVGFVEVQQKNFDFTNWPTFTGGGQQITVRAELGSIRRNSKLSFTEPWIFDYPVSGGFDVFQTTREKEDDVGFAYDEERVGGVVRFGKQLTEYLSGKVSYRREVIDIDNLDSDVSAALKAEQGENTISNLSLNIVQDTTNSAFNPSTGYVVGGTADVAGGFLGGDKDFYRFQGHASYYVPLKFNSVLEFRGNVGVADPYGDSARVPIFERFFAGGARTIRGYEERSVGPVDSVSEDPVGGEALLVGNIEYTVPLIEFLKLAAFYDIGNVWAELKDFGSGDFKSGVGLGLRVRTPVGPINLDYGFPLNDQVGDDGDGKFYFSVSRGF